MKIGVERVEDDIQKEWKEWEKYADDKRIVLLIVQLNSQLFISVIFLYVKPTDIRYCGPGDSWGPGISIRVQFYSNISI